MMVVWLMTTPALNDRLDNGEVGLIFTFTTTSEVELTTFDFTANAFGSVGTYQGVDRNWDAVNFSVFAGTGTGGTQQGSTWTVDPGNIVTGATSISDTVTGTVINLGAGTYTVYLSVVDNAPTDNSNRNYAAFSDFELNATVIPEPSMFGLVAVCGGAALFIRRRKSSI